MKSRYERRIEWLKGQIGSWRAYLIEIGKGALSAIFGMRNAEIKTSTVKL